MSTLKADTIQSTGGGAATLTKQEATKHWVNYDAADSTIDGSLNQSSITDHTTGDFSSAYSNNFSSATNKCHFGTGLNSTDGGANRTVAANRAGIAVSVGHLISDSTANPLSTSEVQFCSAYGSSAAGDAVATDFSATYCTSIGDLA